MRTDESHRETVTDADLIRLLDGELTGAEQAALRARVDASPDAAARLETLRRRSTRLSALLPEVDPAPHRVDDSADAIRRRMAALRWGGPRGRGVRHPGLLRAAAAVALLLAAGAIAVPPARAWVVDQVRHVAVALGLATTPITPATPAPNGPTGADLAVTFPVAGDVFEIHLPRAAGVLVIRAGPGATGSAEAEGPAGDAAPGVSFVVLPAGLRIDGARPGVEYRVTLPAAAASVRVRAGDGPPIEHPLPPPGQTLRIEGGRMKDEG